MGISALTISLQPRVLGDSYSWEQLFDEPRGTAHSGYIYGWPLNCTVTGKSFNPKTKRYSFTGDDGIGELLKKYVNFSSPPATARAAMEVVAGRLGKTLVFLADDHSIAEMAKKTTVMQVIESLYGWTSAIPTQQVNVFLRGSVMYVIQRGKETSTYTPVKYDVIDISEPKPIDTLMEEDDTAIVSATDAGEVANGTYGVFGSSVTYVDGYISQETQGGKTTTYGWASTDANDPDSTDKYLVSVSVTETGKLDIVTTKGYGTYDGALYQSSETTGVKTGYLTGGHEYFELSTTTYIPAGKGFFTARTVKETWTYELHDGGESITSHTVYNPEYQTTYGIPGGKTAPTRFNSEKLTASVNGNPKVSATIPATDQTTVDRYAAQLNWLDGKTEYRAKITVYDQHIIDFTETINLFGQTWYLDGNTISVDASFVGKQSIDLVRWA